MFVRLTNRLLHYISSVSSMPRAYRVLIESLNAPYIQRGLKEVRKLNCLCMKGDGAKYLHSFIWLLDNALRIVKLSLDRSTPLRILDLGSGPGYFIAMARSLGHDAQGIDLGEHPIYTPMNRAFENIITWHKITPHMTYVNGDLSPFDLITAFSVTFNKHNRQNRESMWSSEDWICFFSNLKPLIHSNSKIVFQLNTQSISGCQGDEFKVFRTNLLSSVGFELETVGKRFVEIVPAQGQDMCEKSI